MVKAQHFTDIPKTNLLILSIRLISVSGAVIWTTYPNLYLANVNKLLLIYLYNSLIYIYTLFFVIRFYFPPDSNKCEYFCLFTFIFDQAVISYFTYTTGGFSSPFYSGYFVVISISAFVLGTKPSFIVALTGAIFYILFNLSYGIGIYNIGELIYRIVPFFVIVFPTGILSDAMEKHLKEIDDLNLELSEKNKKLEESLRKIEAIQQQLIKKEKEKAMLDLAESVAHRLRNPLMSLGGIASIVDKKLKKGAKPEELEKYIEYIKTESKNMSMLLDNLLTMSDSAVELKFSVLQNIVKEVIEEYKNAISSNKIKLTLKIEEKLPPVRTDPKKLKMALKNIIDNCIKVMPNGGELFVGIKKSEEVKNSIEIVIKDTGPGIPKDILRNIFKPFESGGKVKKGLGLPLAKHTIEILGGELYIDSKIAEGTTFKIILPM
ncbi:ATP-binding protein [Hippea alviniae]|uniref:ATP-binding protein n=1 Tax=Hippea alviniae TaxID=1279027 RepID=UPI0003B72A04|nr:ATP-binding protein [Hippea alviniae]